MNCSGSARLGEVVVCGEEVAIEADVPVHGAEHDILRELHRRPGAFPCHFRCARTLPSSRRAAYEANDYWHNCALHARGRSITAVRNIAFLFSGSLGDWRTTALGARRVVATFSPFGFGGVLAARQPWMPREWRAHSDRVHFPLRDTGPSHKPGACFGSLQLGWHFTDMQHLSSAFAVCETGACLLLSLP